MNIDELTNTSNSFLSTFGLQLDIPIEINPRLRSTLGQFICLPKRKKAERIELSRHLIEVADKSIIIDTLLHECLHYALFTLGLPYKDEDKYFTSEAKRLGIGLTEEVFVGYEYVVSCNQCGKEAHTEIKRHLDEKLIGSKYKTNCCNSGYKHIKTIINNGIRKEIITI